jgi:hypothetical protein
MWDKEVPVASARVVQAFRGIRQEGPGDKGRFRPWKGGMWTGCVQPGGFGRRFLGKGGEKVDRARLITQTLTVCRHMPRTCRHEQQDQ